MPAWSLQPLSYTTPPFAAASGIVEDEAPATLMTLATEAPSPDAATPVLEGPFWAMITVAAIVVVLIGSSIAWWRLHQRRIEQGYCHELAPVSNYAAWREREATKLLNTSTNASSESSVSQSRRDSGSQKSASPVRRDGASSSGQVKIRK